jgi:serine/threonine protein kinase
MDLKPQNILLDDSMVRKIVDFGLSRRLSESQSRTITKHIGTPYATQYYADYTKGNISPVMA